MKFLQILLIYRLFVCIFIKYEDTRYKYFSCLKELGLTVKAEKAVDALNIDAYDPDFC